MVDLGVALQSGEEVDGGWSDGVALVAVAMTDTKGSTSGSRMRYGGVAAAVQMVWPDADGLLPLGGRRPDQRGRAAGARVSSGGAAGVSRRPNAGRDGAGVGRPDE